MSDSNLDPMDLVRASDLAKQIIGGSLDLVAGCRALRGVLPGITPDTPDFVVVIAGFESNTDHYPIGRLRDKFHADELERLDHELQEYIDGARASVLDACKQIIEAANLGGARRHVLHAWPFEDARDTAVFTSWRILRKEEWIHYVTHDSEDGAWQFHPFSAPTPLTEAALVSLETVFSLDGSIAELADLPMGWHAWRDSPDGAWIREPREEEVSEEL